MPVSSAPSYGHSPCCIFGPEILSSRVNFLAFNAEGSYLAIGSEDLRVFILQTGTWAVTRVYKLAKAQPTVATWAKTTWPAQCLFFGDISGDLHDIVIGQTPEADKKNVSNVRGLVYALATEGSWLAVSAGSNVSCLEVLSYASDQVFRNGAIACQRPSTFQGLETGGAESIEPVAVDLQYVPGGALLIGIYERHGVLLWDRHGHSLKHILPNSVCIGGACLSPLGDRLYVTNLADGVDIYKIVCDYPETSTWERTLHTSIGVNLPVPVTAVHDGNQILLGGTEGHIQILSPEPVASDPFLNWSRTAPAFFPLILTVAYTSIDGPQRTHYVAFGAHAQGKDACVVVYSGTVVQFPEDKDEHAAVRNSVFGTILRDRALHALTRSIQASASLLILAGMGLALSYAVKILVRLIRWALSAGLGPDDSGDTL